MVRLLVLALRNDGANPMPSQPLADAVVAVSLVAGHRGGASSRATDRLWNPNRIHRFFELRGFMRLSRGDVDG